MGSVGNVVLVLEKSRYVRLLTVYTDGGSMVDLPFRSKFGELPEINPEEFGISPDYPVETVFTAADFSYIGVHVIDGIETMC